MTKLKTKSSLKKRAIRFNLMKLKFCNLLNKTAHKRSISEVLDIKIQLETLVKLVSSTSSFHNATSRHCGYETSLMVTTIHPIQAIYHPGTANYHRKHFHSNRLLQNICISMQKYRKL